MGCLFIEAVLDRIRLAIISKRLAGRQRGHGRRRRRQREHGRRVRERGDAIDNVTRDVIGHPNGWKEGIDAVEGEGDDHRLNLACGVAHALVGGAVEHAARQVDNRPRRMHNKGRRARRPTPRLPGAPTPAVSLPRTLLFLAFEL